MSCRSVRGKLVSQRSPAGPSGVLTGRLPEDDILFALCDLENKRRENEELDAEFIKGKQMLESLQQRRDELDEKMKKTMELHLNYDNFLKSQDADQAAEKTERERKDVIRMDADRERLKVESTELMERKQKLEHDVQRKSVYRNFMERAVKMTKFDDMGALTDHLEGLLHIRDQLCQRDSKGQRQIDQQRKVIQRLEDEHHFMWLKKNNQLSQLQTQLEEAHSEALTWERKWSHIQETAAKKTLLLGQVKMVALNLCEMTYDKEEDGEEAVDMNDTDKQLEKITMFIQDHQDIMNQHQTPEHRQDGQKKDKPKKRIIPCKKHASKKP